MTIQFLTCLLAGLLAFTVAASAQSEVVTVHVPFTFEAGGKSLPAGDYRVDREGGSNLLLIHGGSGNVAVFLTMSVDSAASSETASLVFARQGEKLVLSGVRLPGHQSRVAVGSHAPIKAALSISTVAAAAR